MTSIAAPNGITPIRLSELNGSIKQALQQAFTNTEYWVMADVSNHNYYRQKNYHFFDLSESAGPGQLLAKIAASAYGQGCNRILDFEKITGQRFTNNISILVKVTVSFHEIYGLKLNLVDIDPNFTLGALERQRRQTLERLVRENTGVIEKIGDRYRTQNSRLSLPKVIQRIALIASHHSAGYEDFHHTLKNNPLGYRFMVDDYHTSVQGSLNQQELLDNLIAVFRSGKRYDTVVIVRGGGAQTDLLIFDQYMIGKAIARFPIPVITGIGHQRNETVADLMAHTQTKTPTQSAEFVIQHNRAFEESILLFQKNILIRTQQLFSRHFQDLSSLNNSILHGAKNLIAEHKQTLINSNRLAVTKSASIIFNRKNELINLSSQVLARPRVVVYTKQNDIETVANNLKSFSAKYLINQRGYLNHHISMIRVMTPDSILQRGFALVRHNGKLITRAEEINIGAEIDVILSETKLRASVNQKSKYDGREFNV